MIPDGHPEDAMMPLEYLARISLSIRGYRMTRPSRFASVDAFIRLTRPSSVSAHIVRWVIRPPPDTSLGLRRRCCGSISGFQLVSQLTRVWSCRAVSGVTYASMPMIGLTPSLTAVLHISYAPCMLPWSVMPTAGILSSLARLTRSGIFDAPSSSE